MEISKLPKWAQKEFHDLQRERDIAIRALNQYVDSQTVSSFYIDELECTGETQGPIVKRRYIQTRKVTVEYEGVELNIYLRDDHIDMQWSSPENTSEHIAFVPTSFQSAKLLSKKNMRD